MLTNTHFIKTYSSFDSEIIRSELNRARLMLVVLVLLLISSLTVRILVGAKVHDVLGSAENYFYIMSLIGAMIIFEGVIMWRISLFLKRGQGVEKAFQLLYSFVETVFLSILMWYMMDAHTVLLSLESPLYLLYILIIFLSALHLNFKLSLVVGSVAAVQYSLVIFYAVNYRAETERLPEIIYYSRCIFILISGATAGFVAEEIKRRVKSYLKVKDAKNALELTFGQQVSEKIAHVLLEQGDQARPMEVTVLALDIRDFTVFADSHTPDELLAFQNKIFGPILTIIESYGGIVNQILGDGVMAVFGAPVADQNHVQKAFEASLAILDKVKEMSDAGEIPLTRLGIGLNTGDVITGNIGTVTRKQYSFSGTTVIIAFRVEQLNKEFNSELLVTEKVSALIHSGINLEYLGCKMLKGLNQELGIYRVK